MSFKRKEVKVILTGNAREVFENLDNQILFNSIKQKIEFLKENPQYGIHIPKNKIPKEYITNYDINNLWKVNLSGAWRMIYTIRGSEIEIISLILDILNHKDYEKKFRYKKS